MPSVNPQAAHAPDTELLGSHDDVTWVLTSSFIIFTMQSGFGLLESGSVAPKNEVNIMVKNAVDVIFGGITYWLFGYGLSFGSSEWSNGFCGWGDFLLKTNGKHFGEVYTKFFFHASFATTATTIVSGAMAERTKLESYACFSALNTAIFCLPAHWLWANNGWLAEMGAIDIAGSGPVHVVGGVTGLIATLIIKPRHERYQHKARPPMGSPINATLGMFMLWWGWIGFNCGSTFGITGNKWKLVARAGVATVAASIGGGTIGILLSYVLCRRRLDVSYLINGVLASLVSITGYCALAHPWEAFVIGCVGAVISLLAIEGLDKLEIDDPVGCVGVHAFSGIWGLLAVGLFVRPDTMLESILHTPGAEIHIGLFHGGGWYLLGVQTLTASILILWTAVTSFLLLSLINVTIGLRVSLDEEVLGSDIVEHGVRGFVYDKKSRKLSLGKSTRGFSTLYVNNSSTEDYIMNNFKNITMLGKGDGTGFAERLAMQRNIDSNGTSDSMNQHNDGCENWRGGGAEEETGRQGIFSSIRALLPCFKAHSSRQSQAVVRRPGLTLSEAGLFYIPEEEENDVPMVNLDFGQGLRGVQAKGDLAAARRCPSQYSLGNGEVEQRQGDGLHAQGGACSAAVAWSHSFFNQLNDVNMGEDGANGDDGAGQVDGQGQANDAPIANFL